MALTRIKDAVDLSDGFALAPMGPDQAERLGARFATIPPWALYPYPASALIAYFAASDERAPRRTITCDGAVIGAIGLQLGWLRGPYVQFLGLLPGHQSTGAGARVLDWLEGEACAAGERNLWVCASDFNTGALRFYERHGFSPIANLEGLVRDDRTEVLLRKRLWAGAAPV